MPGDYNLTAKPCDARDTRGGRPAARPPAAVTSYAACPASFAERQVLAARRVEQVHLVGVDVDVGLVTGGEPAGRVEGDDQLRVQRLTIEITLELLQLRLHLRGCLERDVSVGLAAEPLNYVDGGLESRPCAQLRLVQHIGVL